MSVGPLGGGVGPSAAGAPYAQQKGSDVERAAHDGANQQRQVDNQQKAEKAAGIGDTEEESEAQDRDADGRRIWEEPERPESAAEESHDDPAPRGAKDPTGQSGNNLDLSG